MWYLAPLYLLENNLKISFTLEDSITILSILAMRFAGQMEEMQC